MSPLKSSQKCIKHVYIGYKYAYVIKVFSWLIEGVHLLLYILQPLPRQNWAVIGCSENRQSIGVTVHSDLLLG